MLGLQVQQVVLTRAVLYTSLAVSIHGWRTCCGPQQHMPCAVGWRVCTVSNTSGLFQHRRPAWVGKIHSWVHKSQVTGWQTAVLQVEPQHHEVRGPDSRRGCAGCTAAVGCFHCQALHTLCSGLQLVPQGLCAEREAAGPLRLPCAPGTSLRRLGKQSHACHLSGVLQSVAVACSQARA